MKLTLLLAVSTLAHIFVYAQPTTLFEQNFNNSTNLSDYTSSSPSASQFNFIGVNQNVPPITSMASISNQKLLFDRPSAGDACGITRTKINNTSTTAPDNIIVSFKISVNTLSVPITGSSPGIFYIGQSYSTNFTIPTNASTFSRLGIVFTSTPNNFKLKNLSTGAESAEFSGEQSIMWVMNNSGNTMKYTSPTGSLVSLDNDKVDVWVGNSQIFTAVAPQTATVSLSDFKFSYGNGTGQITIDDILIQTVSAVLPVQLSYFKASQTKNVVELKWQTESEQNNDHFDIEHSVDGTSFYKIGEVKSQKETGSKHDYQFTHSTPSVQKGFYRLKQQDLDGNYSLSKIEEIAFTTQLVTIYPNPAKDFLYIQSPAETTNELYFISDIFGRVVLSNAITMQNETISLQNIPKGLYYVKKGNTIIPFFKN